MNLNKVFVLGNLTRDPEKRALPSGQSVVNFGLASNRYYNSQDGQKQTDTEFHNIVIFGKTAEIAAQYLRKGSLALIEGRLKTRNWQDAQGIKHYKTEVIAERMQLGPKSNNASSQTPYQTPQSSAGYNKKEESDNIPIIEEPTTEQAPSTTENKKETKEHFFEPDENEINVEEIPF